MNKSRNIALISLMNNVGFSVQLISKNGRALSVHWIARAFAKSTVESQINFRDQTKKPERNWSTAT